MSSAALVPQSSLKGAEKLARVKSLLENLARDIEEAHLQPHERDAALEELKVLGRDPRDSDPIFAKEGIATLGAHAFDSTSVSTSRNALRCIANALFLNPSARQLFVDLGFGVKACAKLKNDSWDDELLVSRVLLLATYVKTVDLSALVTEHGLADGIARRLARHAEFTQAATKIADPIEEMALTETARLLFNVAHLCPDQRSSYAAAAPHILTLLWKRRLAGSVTQALDPPLGPLVNALSDLDLDSDDADSAAFPDADPVGPTRQLVEILDLALRQYGDGDLELTVLPLVVTISRIYKLGPKSVREFLQRALLPTSKDREQVLGLSQSLPSRLLKNTTNALAPGLRSAIPLLLFDMSDKDPTKFIENVGYGFASGFLFQNGIPIPEASLRAPGEAGGAVGARRDGKEINPITGQFLDSEKPPPDLLPMTDEEKEREAERLFVLFERLKKTGIVDIQNPVEKAFQEGRLEELDENPGKGEKRTK